MERIYIIMEENEAGQAEPIDYCVSLADAEDLCLEYEATYPAYIYYWRALIKGE